MRKHALALLCLSMVHLILFFPVLFMGRVVSPNDIYYSYDPWRSIHNVESQNPIINDPPASYLTLVSLLKDDPVSFHWNRYIASGVPGYGSLGAAVLSPFVLLAAFLLPLLFFYTGLILLKLNFSFIAAYIWLRHERLGKRGAAIGALVFAMAGSYAVWWLWQATNATVLYPVVMITALRLGRRQRLSIPSLSLLAVALILSGFPAVVVYVTYLAIAYVIYLCIRQRQLPRGEDILRCLAALGIALLITAPSLIPFARFLRSTGYLESRTSAGLLGPYPASHLRLFIEPFAFGDPVAHRWRMTAATPSSSDNLVESSIYLGLLTLPMIALGLFGRRLRTRNFWLLSLAILILLMFARTPLSELIGRAPGIRYSPLTRLRALLPLAAAALAANGTVALATWLRRRVAPRPARLFVYVIAAVLAYDLAFFAARFYPYLEPGVANVPRTPSIRYLAALPAPFRVAPMFDDLWPNAAELFRIEDIRSHFSSEAGYRALIQRIDPQSWGSSGTVLQLNSLNIDFHDPLFHLLNARYVLEQPSIDILRWKSEERTRVKVAAQTFVVARDAMTRDIDVDADGITAVRFLASPEGRWESGALLRARLERPETGEIVGAVSVPAELLRRNNKVYVPLRQAMKADEHLLLSVESQGMNLRIGLGGAEEGMAYSLVDSPLVPLADLADGRIFEDVRALPRYFAVWESESLDLPAMLKNRDLDYARTAVLEEQVPSLAALRSVAPAQRRVRFAVEHYDGATQQLRTDSAVPFFLVASEKFSPELQITIDGASAAFYKTDGLFTGLKIPAGSHQIEFRRRLGRGLWPSAVAGLLLLIATTALERGPRGRP